MALCSLTGFPGIKQNFPLVPCHKSGNLPGSKVKYFGEGGTFNFDWCNYFINKQNNQKYFSRMHLWLTALYKIIFKLM